MVVLFVLLLVMIMTLLFVPTEYSAAILHPSFCWMNIVILGGLRGFAYTSIRRPLLSKKGDGQ
jgi:hypothetical protein